MTTDAGRVQLGETVVVEGCILATKPQPDEAFIYRYVLKAPYNPVSILRRAALLLKFPPLPPLTTPTGAWQMVLLTWLSRAVEAGILLWDFICARGRESACLERGVFGETDWDFSR